MAVVNRVSCGRFESSECMHYGQLARSRNELPGSATRTRTDSACPSLIVRHMARARRVLGFLEQHGHFRFGLT